MPLTSCAGGVDLRRVVVEVDVFDAVGRQVRVLRQRAEVELIELKAVGLASAQLTHHVTVDGADAAERDERAELERHLCLVDALDVGRRQVGVDLAATDNECRCFRVTSLTDCLRKIELNTSPKLCK